MADDDSIQSRFNRKYQDFLTQTSQSLLPLPQIAVPDWKKMLESGSVKQIYVDPDRFYNNKIYTFTMYQAGDGGSYYLDAKGGFWGWMNWFTGRSTPLICNRWHAGLAHQIEEHTNAVFRPNFCPCRPLRNHKIAG